MIKGSQTRLELPCVTVGMPVFNDPAGLRRTIPTVFGQTWPGQVRLLVVDDGSTDETPEILASLAEVYKPLEVIRNPTNLGRPSSRNKILDLAGDNFLAWIDAGDLWHPRKLELQLGTLLNAEERNPGIPLLCTGSVRWAFADRGEERIRATTLAGDQLHNALTGTLYPYLQALVGRAEHFRNVGGFDERLLRRQDYDFLVRFVGEGGRLIGAPEHVPMFTYIKSDVGRSARLVAASNRVIRSKHRRYYHRLGRRIAWQVRGNQHRLVARFYRHNGKKFRGLAYSTLAELSDPDPVAMARRAARLVWPSRRKVRRIAQKLRRPLRRALPILRRQGLTEFARRLGLFRLPGVSSLTRTIYVELRLELEKEIVPSVRTSHRHKLQSVTRELEKEVSVLRVAPVDQWLRLEEAYRQQGLLHSAESSLRKAIDCHPDSVELRLRLLELLPLRKKWGECVELWSDFEGLDERGLRGITYARVARSFRQLGDHAAALSVAEKGIRRWPDNFRTWDEVYRNRAALVDWTRAVVVPRRSTATAETRCTVGAVDDLGFLIGTDAPMAGEVEARVGDAPSVSLVVNGTPVATTYAAEASPGAARARFTLSCHELRQYVGDGDVISIERQGEPLMMEGYGPFCEIWTGYKSRFPELVRQLSRGYVFTKFGMLRMGNTPETKRQTLALFREVSRVIEQRYNYSVFPFYGNLLGIVRENDFIAHDAGGFDMGYVSRHHRPEDVRAEFLDLCRLLVSSGYHVRVEPWSVYVRPSPDARNFVDVNYAWFSEAGELGFSFGWRHRPASDADGFFRARDCPIGNEFVKIPGNAEAVLEQIYGSSWAVPDQGFELDAGLIRDSRYLLTVGEMMSLEGLDPDRIELRLEHHPEF